MAAPALEADFARQLNRDCRCVGVDVPALHRWLERDLRARGLVEPIVTTHPHLFSALPVFVAREQARQMDAIITAAQSVIAMPAYQERVLAQAPDIARRPQRAHGVFFGYDFHLCESGPQLIEINTNAGGALLNTASMRAQRACCAPVERYLQGASSETIEAQFVQMFRQEWARSSDKPLTRIAIVDDAPAGQYLFPEFLLLQRLFEAHGIATAICDPRDLAYDQSHLTLHGEAIDLVYNRITDFYFEEPAHAALAAAFEAGHAVVTPHPQAHALYANKKNLAILSSERELRALGVSAQLIEVLVSGIPETRIVDAAASEPWWADRKRWFFKPAGGFASRGSYRGDKLTRKAFADVAAGGYIAQLIAQPGERSGGDEDSSYKWDVRNYVYDGAPLLMAARLYQGQTTNFRTPGGGFAPVYVVP